MSVTFGQNLYTVPCICCLNDNDISLHCTASLQRNDKCRYYHLFDKKTAWQNTVDCRVQLATRSRRHINGTPMFGGVDHSTMKLGRSPPSLSSDRHAVFGGIHNIVLLPLSRWHMSDSPFVLARRCLAISATCLTKLSVWCCSSLQNATSCIFLLRSYFNFKLYMDKRTDRRHTVA